MYFHTIFLRLSTLHRVCVLHLMIGRDNWLISLSRPFHLLEVENQSIHHDI